MNNVPPNITSIRTTEDIINVLSILHFNLNEIERIYYDMFINKEPMDITFWRYDDQGVLGSITLPNRAKDRIQTLIGSGGPNGIVEAKVGALYLDSSSGSLYVKSFGSDSSGWTQLWDSVNLAEGINYLTPNGDGSQLTNLNMSNAGSGVLAVGRGGTGATGITGLVKGNGESAFTAAVDGVDYFGPKSLTGAILYYPVSTTPSGWLRCDGAAYSRTTYRRLFEIIGTTYGVGDGSTTFNVPDLMNYYVRCWDGSAGFNTVLPAQVGSHSHTFEGTTGTEGAHTHDRGTMEIYGAIISDDGGYAYSPYSRGYRDKITQRWRKGALYVDDPEVVGVAQKDVGGIEGSNKDRADGALCFKASNDWSGRTGGGSTHSHSFSGTTRTNSSEENTVTSKFLVPIIKY